MNHCPIAPMSTQADIPSYTDNRTWEFQCLDAELNSMILYALLYGMYTGILTVTLWNIFFNKCWPIRRAMVVVIILLHALITINFAATWSRIHSSFIKNGHFFETVYLRLNNDHAASLEMGIPAFMSAIITDFYMIWCCWMVWGRCWLVVLPPILSLISATVAKITVVYYQYHININTPEAAIFPIISVLYISFVLVTTLWCTLLIIYRILTVAGAKRRADGRLNIYQHFIGVFVESSALYSISLIVFLALTVREDFGLYYLDAIAGIAKGVAPTLVIGRFAAGRRARPDDSWQGSVIGSASIRSCSQEHSGASFREDDRANSMLDGDLEAQRESPVTKPSSTRRSVCFVADYAHANTDHVSPETSPHLRNRSFIHDRSSLYEDNTLDSTVVDETTASSR
ncbi:hypothetical protein ARMGADRAFT_1164511 [Armillaria gallica]|uniref:Uncharacterized protein n=1 Tax=Armillaria gallica TaxID=47427 RepID=A0A2H3DU52_ARMGA|nr:hypothetical protein ARMGADRAFT_1164511 [Armillaria gallica]